MASAQRMAQLFSLLVFVLMARWYFVPWSRNQSRARALVPLLWIQVFRYVALQIISAQQAGFPISEARRDHILYGDLLGATLAVLALVALRFRARWSIAVVWLLVAETAYDIVNNVSGGIHEHLFGVATGTTWFVQSFYVPLVVVSAGTTAWHLIARRREGMEVRTRSQKAATGPANA